MAIRTTQSQAIFTAPFVLPEIDYLLPAGTYDVETEEEVIEGNEQPSCEGGHSALCMKSRDDEDRHD